MDLILRALLRGGIPLIIMTGIAASLKYGNNELTPARGTFFGGLITAAVAAASVLYEIPGWSLYKSSSAHFGVMAITVYPCLLLSGWFPMNNAMDALKIFGYFLAMGVVLWFVFYMIFTRFAG